jgi:hypothetical protein
MPNFQWKNSEGWDDVPILAQPGDEGGYAVVVYPDPTDVDGLGNPAGIFGYPVIQIAFKMIYAGRDSSEGMRWWLSFFPGTSTVLVPGFAITAFDPRLGDWAGYRGTLIRPMHGPVQPGVAPRWYVYPDVNITIKDLVLEPWP